MHARCSTTCDFEFSGYLNNGTQSAGFVREYLREEGVYLVSIWHHECAPLLDPHTSPTAARFYILYQRGFGRIGLTYPRQSRCAFNIIPPILPRL